MALWCAMHAYPPREHWVLQLSPMHAQTLWHEVLMTNYTICFLHARLRSTKAAGSQQGLVLIAGAYVLPHPDKMQKGGEDWFYISDTMRSVGVADGVGGWVSGGAHTSR